MGEGTRSSSTPDSIARALRHDLLAGDLAPGTRLTEEALSARFGCGRHSVRAGLQALVAEGLLEHQRNKGHCGSRGDGRTDRRHVLLSVGPGAGRTTTRARSGLGFRAGRGGGRPAVRTR
ncbi:GntR family transcriptional regulator [Nocardia cyriacigeorgica]|nr:GntR family transcriptional regulator [Nocardia cyriacigeorgica]MBF6199642.1 GntR family transcriptional regulator [Nocardia cyriacigeorgica]